MDDKKSITMQQFTKEIIDGDKMVTIIVQEMDVDRWELSIRGKKAQATTWTEWFTTSQEAMEAGKAIILKEGIDEFYSDSEFEYL